MEKVSLDFDVLAHFPFSAVYSHVIQAGPRYIQQEVIALKSDKIHGSGVYVRREMEAWKSGVETTSLCFYRSTKFAENPSVHPLMSFLKESCILFKEYEVKQSDADRWVSEFYLLREDAESLYDSIVGQILGNQTSRLSISRINESEKTEEELPIEVMVDLEKSFPDLRFGIDLVFGISEENQSDLECLFLTRDKESFIFMQDEGMLRIYYTPETSEEPGLKSLLKWLGERGFVSQQGKDCVTYVSARIDLDYAFRSIKSTLDLMKLSALV